MRVAIDARYIRTTDDEVQPKGGVGRYTYHLLREMIRLEPELDLRLIVPQHNGRPIFPDPPCRVEEVRYGDEPNTLRTKFLLARAVDLRDRQLFHSPFNMLPSALPCPTAVTIHDLMWVTHPKLCSKLLHERLTIGKLYWLGITHALAAADQVITVSDASRREIEGYRPALAGRVAVTHHGVESFFFEELSDEAARRELEPLFDQRGRYLLCVGQGSPYKNHVRLIEAFLEAFRAEPEVKLVLVRRFSRLDTDLLRLLARPGVRRRLIRLPSVTEAQLRALYHRARIFAFPSLMEGFGIPPLEAMACGAPVLSGSVSSMPEVCGDAALLVDPTDTAAIASGLRRLDRDEALRDQLVERGRARARSFRWEDCARQTLAVYRRTIDRVSP